MRSWRTGNGACSLGAARYPFNRCDSVPAAGVEFDPADRSAAPTFAIAVRVGEDAAAVLPAVVFGLRGSDGTIDALSLHGAIVCVAPNRGSGCGLGGQMRDAQRRLSEGEEPGSFGITEVPSV